MAYRTKQGKDVQQLLPPQSLDTEQAVLGAIMKDTEALNHVIEIIDEPGVFYAPKHQKIYRAALQLYEKSEPCDITTIANQLVMNDQLESIGGRVYLVELVEAVASTANVASYANIVLENGLLRRLINTSNEITHSCYQHTESVQELLDKAESEIFGISESRLRKGFVRMKELVKPTIEEVEQVHLGESMLAGIETGFVDLDRMTLGFHRGDFIVVAGRPSMGKTSLAMNIAENIAARDKNPLAVGIFSVEMSAYQLVLRMLCGRAGLNQQKVRGGKLDDEGWGRLVAAGNKVSQMPIFIDDSPSLSILEVRAKARRLKAQQDVELIIIDYMQLMHSTGRAENRQQEMSQISRSLKALAKEINVPVVGVSQLSRQVEQRGGDKRPQLSDLRESGAIEQDADLVIFVNRPEFNLKEEEKSLPENKELLRKAEIIIAKQRNGPTGQVELVFLKELARFGNRSKVHREIPPGVEPVDRSDSPF